MRRVSYQGMLGPAGGPPGGSPPAGVYVRLGEDAIGTRRKDARATVRFEISKAQAHWLKDAVEMSGPGIDEGQVLRALVDLGMELDVDWAVIARGTALRAAVRESVMVRRPGPG
jgi:hypothetical protein